MLAANVPRPKCERLTFQRLFEGLRQQDYHGGHDSVRRYGWAWAKRETQEMVFDAHEKAFAFFKGTPRRGIYESMKTAVDAVFVGKERRCNRRFALLTSHHLIEPTACAPAAGWEKGQVENQVGGARKRFFAPRPSFKTLDDLNDRLLDKCTTITNGATTLRSFTYDPNGNTLSDTRSGALYAYTNNQNNRLKTVTVAGNVKATYTYDAAEQLAVRVLTNMTPSGTIHDVYDRDGNLLMESNGLSAGITQQYMCSPGRRERRCHGPIPRRVLL